MGWDKKSLIIENKIEYIIIVNINDKNWNNKSQKSDEQYACPSPADNACLPSR